MINIGQSFQILLELHWTFHPVNCWHTLDWTDIYWTEKKWERKTILLAWNGIGGIGNLCFHLFILHMCSLHQRKCESCGTDNQGVVCGCKESSYSPKHERKIDLFVELSQKYTFKIIQINMYKDTKKVELGLDHMEIDRFWLSVHHYSKKNW